MPEMGNAEEREFRDVIYFSSSEPCKSNRGRLREWAAERIP